MKQTAIVLVVLLSFAVAPVVARNTYLTEMLARYNIPDTSKLNSCTTCHSGFWPRNAYGAQLEAAGAATDIIAAFAATDTLDADGDAARNWVELVNGTWPADPNDFVPVQQTSWGRIKSLYDR